MEIVKIVAIGLVTCFASMIVKNLKPEICPLINLTGGILIILMLVNVLTDLLGNFSDIFVKTGISKQILSPVLKIIGVGYLSEFSANICHDCGSQSIADKILFAGKVLILLLSIPIINQVIEIVMGLL